MNGRTNKEVSILSTNITRSRKNGSKRRSRRKKKYIPVAVKKWYGWQQEQKFPTKDEIMQAAVHVANKNVFSQKTLLQELTRRFGIINGRHTVELLEDLVDDGKINFAPGRLQYRILR